MKNNKDELLDLQMDKLLRSHLKNSPTQPAKCDGFDADLATAYAEKTLSTLALQSYESHLADCLNCRQMTTEYLLLFGAEIPMEEPKEEILQPSKVTLEAKENAWSLANLREWLFGSQLRWVMAAILVVFITGTAWVFYNRNNANQVAGNKPNPKVEQNNSQNNSQNDGSTNVTATPLPDNNIKEENNNPKLATDNKKSLPKVEQNNNKKDNDAQSLPQNNINIAEQPQIANNSKDSKEAVKLPSLPKDTNIDIADNKTSTPSININPIQTPIPPVNDIALNPDKNFKNPTTNRNPKGDFIGRSLTEEERKEIGGKKFLLKSSIWTDEEYLRSNSKNLKRVELKNGSEEYQKVLAANPELKAYFGLKTVIVVYQNVVYIVK